MKINFDKPIMTLDGKEQMHELRQSGVKEKPCETCGHQEDGTKRMPLTLAMVCTTAVLSETADPKTPQKGPDLTGNEKIERFLLAQHIRGGGELDLEAEQIALIKAQVTNRTSYSIVVVAQALLQLENKDEEPTDDVSKKDN